jgi:hypothetical protein
LQKLANLNIIKVAEKYRKDATDDKEGKRAEGFLG